MCIRDRNYHTWRTENDKLLQRMGELRHNGEEAKGAWFRVKGSKTVSYTHLDVYKRQELERQLPATAVIKLNLTVWDGLKFMLSFPVQ